MSAIAEQRKEHFTAEQFLVERYAHNPHNLFTLVIEQREVRVELFTRANGWQPDILRSPDDVLELPEFGFRCAVRDLYRGTPLA